MASRRGDPERLYDQADRWFQRINASFRGALPCRLGCSHCCIGPFPITILDVQHIQQALFRLPDPVRHIIESTAQQQIAQLKQSAPDLFHHSPYLDYIENGRVDTLVEEYAHLPCPALDEDGQCRIYAHRPLTCRMMGVPLEEDGTMHGACQVQTFIPLTRIARVFRQEEEDLIDREREALDDSQVMNPTVGEEMLLPFGFVFGTWQQNKEARHSRKEGENLPA